MKLSTTRALLLCGIALAGCSQGPQPGDIATGSILPSMPSLPSLPAASSLLPDFSGASTPRVAERVSGNLYRVPPSDRRIDDAIQRENYALLQAAEAARWAGGSHFIVVNATDRSAGSGSGVPGTLIRVLNLAQGAEAPIGAVAADEIIHFFGPTFGRSAAQDTTPPGGQPG